MLHTAYRASCMNRASVFEWDKRFKEDRESVRDDKKYGRSKEVNTPELIGQRFKDRVVVYHVEVLREFRKRFRRKRLALFKSDQCHFQRYNRPVHNSILVTYYLTKMGIKTLSVLQTLLFLYFGYPLSSETVIMRQLRRWKRLWRRSWTRSHNRTSMGSSKSCWNGTTIALQLE